MSNFRIDKLRRPLSLVLTDGRALSGEVFLRSMSRFRSRPEEPTDLLNDDEPFFALVQDGNAMLVAKASVARAETAFAAADDADVPSLGVPVEVTLRDGTVCTGSIFPETRFDRPRLLDYLNAYRDRFLPIVDAHKVWLVNMNTIAHVREVV
jgi:hypothetical protein